MARSIFFLVSACAATVHAASSDPAGGKLPEVSTVLTKATDKMAEFAKRAAEMQARAEQKQLESKKAFDTLRADYEGKLALQVKENEGVQKANDALQQDISDLNLGGTALVGKLNQLQKDNKVMRNILGNAQMKVDAAELFLMDSLHLVEDHDEALDVLQPAKAQATLDYFLKVASTKEDVPRAEKKSAALLQTATNPLDVDTAQDLTAPDMVAQTLSLSLTDISAATEEGKLQLQRTYQATAAANEAKREALLKTQAGLNETRANMTEHLGKLHIAEEYLISSRSQLKNRMQGMRVFAFKVDETVNAALKALVPLAGEVKVGEKKGAVSANQAVAAVAAKASSTVASGAAASVLGDAQKTEKLTAKAEAAAVKQVQQASHVAEAAEKTVAASAKSAEAAPHKVATAVAVDAKKVVTAAQHGPAAGLRGGGKKVKKAGNRIQKAFQESQDWIASHR